MSDHWTDRLSEYLDGDLPPDERDAIERHLAECPECTALLDELHAVARRAATLADPEPPGALWAAIEARIAAPSPAASPTGHVVPLRPRRGRTFAFTLPQLAAAGLALLLAGGGSVYLLASRAAAVPPVAAAATAGPAGAALPGAQPPAPLARLAATTPELRQYQAAVAGLERVLERGRDRLQPGTVQALERNLAVIDAAIVDARQALARDPANTYLNEHLADSMRRKVELLRVASRIIDAQS